MFLLLLIPQKHEEDSGIVAFIASLVPAVLAYVVWTRFDPAAGFNFQEGTSWIPALNINYRLGVDGASLLMIALTALLTPLAMLASWKEIKERRRLFYSLIFFCEAGLMGTFCAMDLFLFYVFWEVMLIPMYFIIGCFGSGNRVHVALKFLIFTMLGSIIMLVGLVYFYLAAGKTFDMIVLTNAAISFKTQIWLFLAFSLAFAIKVPIVPFHTWLPDAHTEAPTAGSVLLAGLFLKAGAYGFYRIAMPYFPMAVAALRPYIFALAVIGIIYGALISIAQKDLKRLIAYSSVSHLGIVILGLISLNSEGVNGALLQMINHGLSTGALFLLFGALYQRYHTRDIDAFGGVAKNLPILSGLFIFTGLASLGLPGLNNFIGEVLVFIGAFKARPLAAVLSASVVVFSAVYILWAVERVFFGAPKHANIVNDVSVREAFMVAPIVVMIVLLGVYPRFALSKVAGSVNDFVNLAGRYVSEPERARLDIILPTYYKKGIELILPRIIDKEEEKYQDELLSPEIPSESPEAEAHEIENAIRDQNKEIESDTHDIIDPNEGYSPGEGQNPFPDGVPSPGE